MGREGRRGIGPLAPPSAVTDGVLASVSLTSQSGGAGGDGVGLVVELMRVVSEYGGSMNTSLHATESLLTGQLSYFVTGCFQHVYLATSALWGEGALLGTSAVSGDFAGNNFFK